jgi:hypothetical protein
MKRDIFQQYPKFQAFKVTILTLFDFLELSSCSLNWRTSDQT